MRQPGQVLEFWPTTQPGFGEQNAKMGVYTAHNEGGASRFGGRLYGILGVCEIEFELNSCVPNYDLHIKGTPAVSAFFRAFSSWRSRREIYL